MKYYLIEITDGEIQVAGKAVYEYNTEKEAVAGFHQKMGTAMKSDLYTTELLMVVDSYGKVIKNELYTNYDKLNKPLEDVEQLNYIYLNGWRAHSSQRLPMRERKGRFLIK